MANYNPIQTFSFCGKLKVFQSLMFRLEKIYSGKEGWVSSERERLGFWYAPKQKKVAVGVEEIGRVIQFTNVPTTRPIYKTVDVTPEGRASWGVRSLSDKSRRAGIEAYEFDNETRIDFLDGYDSEIPVAFHITLSPIGAYRYT